MIMVPIGKVCQNDDCSFEFIDFSLDHISISIYYILGVEM